MRNISLFCIMFVCLLATQTFAATYTVTITADTGAGSLRAAISSANASIDDDTIEFAIPASDAGCTVGGVCTITMTGSQFQISSATTSGTLAITNTTGASKLLISGNNGRRVFYVLPNGNLTLNGVTVMKGNAGGNEGGGIFNDNGTLTVTNSIISGNVTIGAGAGIFNQSGIVTLTNTTVSGNTVTQSFGGGIANQFGTINLTNSTVSGNTATTSSGGGIFNSGTFTVNNSTVSGNTALFVGGIRNEGILNLNSVTVTNNRSTSTEACDPCAGGIVNNPGGTANLYSTIVAGNTAFFPTSAPDFFRAVSSPSSYNIIGNNQGTTGITNGQQGNQVGTPTNPIDPRLAVLANNGGATQTHALLFNSPALDKGNSYALGIDQRGFTRPVDLSNATFPNAPFGDGADTGAYEAQTAPLAPTAATVTVSGFVTSTLGRGITGIQLSLTDSEGNTRTATTRTGGYYQFEDVQVGETYIISATGKRFTFSQPVQVLNINEETTEVNFIANSEKRLRSF